LKGEKIMKEIKAYIQPFMLQKVTDALHAIHVRGMSVQEIKGFGKEKDAVYSHNDRDDLMEFIPKVRIEIVCRDEDAQQIIACIKEYACTGRQGDGKITVLALEHVISIRTNENDNKAI